MIKQENKPKIIIFISILFLITSIMSLNSPWMKMDDKEEFPEDLEYYIDEVKVSSDGFTATVNYEYLCSDGISDDNPKNENHFCEFDKSNKILKIIIYISIIIVIGLLLIIASDFLENPIISKKLNLTLQKRISIISPIMSTSYFVIWFISTPSIESMQNQLNFSDYYDYAGSYSYGIYLYFISIILSICLSYFILNLDMKSLEQNNETKNNESKPTKQEIRKLKLKEKLESIENLFNENIITDEERIKLREKEIDNFK